MAQIFQYRIRVRFWWRLATRSSQLDQQIHTGIRRVIMCSEPTPYAKLVSLRTQLFHALLQQRPRPNSRQKRMVLAPWESWRLPPLSSAAKFFGETIDWRMPSLQGAMRLKILAGSCDLRSCFDNLLKIVWRLC
jgi:hypothetical protein